MQDVHKSIKEGLNKSESGVRSKPIISNIFAERLFVFTPKEKIIELPNGATPIDFAFRVHTKIGRRITGAIVNGEIAELSRQLKNGDVVEIITAKNKSVVSTLKHDWLKFVKTSTARKEIEKYTKRW